MSDINLPSSYLKLEWKARNSDQDISSSSCDRQFNKNRILQKDVRAPLQNNSCDCGVYLLEYAELFLSEENQDYDDQYLNKRDWFKEEVIISKRQEILDLMRVLREQTIQFRGETQIPETHVSVDPPSFVGKDQDQLYDSTNIDEDDDQIAERDDLEEDSGSAKSKRSGRKQSTNKKQAPVPTFAQHLANEECDYFHS